MCNRAGSNGDGRSSHRACSCGFLELVSNMDDVDSSQDQMGQREPLNRALDGAFDEGMSTKRAGSSLPFRNISRFNVRALEFISKK